MEGPFSVRLLNNDREIHSRMNDTIEVVRSSGKKRSNGLAVVPVELAIDLGGARLLKWPNCTILPGAILNHMDNRSVIDQGQTTSFMDGY